MYTLAWCAFVLFRVGTVYPPIENESFPGILTFSKLVKKLELAHAAPVERARNARNLNVQKEQVAQMAHFEESQHVGDAEKLEKNRVNDLRKRLTKGRMSSNMFEGISETELHHGLRLGSSTTLVGTLEEICYCSETKVRVYCKNQTKQCA